MKRILFISFFSPPIGSGGGERVTKLLKYLDSFEKYLLTSDYPTYKYKDDFFRIPEDVKVYRVLFKDPRVFIPKFLYKFLKKNQKEEKDIVEKYKTIPQSLATKIRLLFFIPDDKIRWVKDSKKISEKIVDDNKIDIVITTSPPHSTHLLGLNLKQKKNIKWVMDLRDLWTENPFVLYPEKVKAVNLKFEERCLRECDLIIVVTESFKKVLLEKFNFLKEEKIKVVHIGFDLDDFKVEPKNLPGFSITYAGSFYSLQTPVFFLKAFKELLNENEEFKKEAKVYILAPFEDNVNRIVNELELNKSVFVSGFIPHKDAISYILGSKLLFLFLGKGGEVTIPQKTYEYLGSGKRILATITDGECKEILKKCGVVDIVSPDDVEGIKKLLLKIYKEYKENKTINYNKNNISEFSMEKISKKFINSLIEGGVL
ncbi:MAG: glycosyltransferase [Caldisericia bacterium]